ncbi:unnamed protein product [Ectocarpus sp. 13 AM-2016]
MANNRGLRRNYQKQTTPVGMIERTHNQATAVAHPHKSEYRQKGLRLAEFVYLCLVNDLFYVFPVNDLLFVFLFHDVLYVFLFTSFGFQENASQAPRNVKKSKNVPKKEIVGSRHPLRTRQNNIKEDTSTSMHSTSNSDLTIFLPHMRGHASVR